MRCALLALALLSACATEPPEPPSLNLAGTSWVLITDAAPAPTMAFTERGASGNAGCNRWFSSTRRSEQALAFGAVGTTRMMCPPAAMQTENAFKVVLDETVGFRVENGELALYGADGVDLARFRRAD